MARTVAVSVVVCSAAAAAAAAGAQERPQLDAVTAARQQVADYLAAGPTPWLPAALHEPGALAALRPDFIVAADGSGTHRSVQAAIDELPPRGDNVRRRVILIRPGTYRERPCLRDKAPVLLLGEGHGEGLGEGGDAARVLIVEGRYAGQSKRSGEAAHPCHPDQAAGAYGTPGSATFVVASDDVQIVGLSIANDAMEAVRDGRGYPPGAGESGGAQGVALLTQGDRIQLEGVRLVGHQDTLFARRPAPEAPARVLVRHSLIAGDVDFIFGSATLVIDESTVRSRAGRRTPGNGGHVLAPSTPPGQALGILVTRSRLEGEPGLAAGSISLGRAWDEGVAAGAWQAGVSPNGQALVRDSALGPHLGPWAGSTSRRPFRAEGPAANRMAEFASTALPGQVWPADAAREALEPYDGWAAAEGGTQGGAAAAPADVHDVRDRVGLLAALKPHPRPRIVRIHGRIDLASDDQGRHLGADDFRDPALDWAAFARAYDPATWGREPPAGPLEEARQRSARRQAAHVVVRVPSNTTIVGAGPGAQITGGSLLLERVDNVVIRHLHLSDAYDHFPAWDPKDNGHGEWNSDYDNITLRGATHVWIDHCTLDDGDRPDAAEPVLLGQRVQRHDGLLDIIRQSDLVTISWNHFRRHDKTALVGGGDRHSDDEGKLRVTFHHNLWEDVKERAPRVRYGRVHVYNNLYVGRSDGAPAFGYSLGVGVASRIVSERNAWQTSDDIEPRRLARWWRGTTFVDRGSIHNGRPVDLLGALRQANPAAVISAEVGWQPTLYGTIDDAAEVPSRVRAGAGAFGSAKQVPDPFRNRRQSN